MSTPTLPPVAAGRTVVDRPGSRDDSATGCRSAQQGAALESEAGLSLRSVERSHIAHVLDLCNWNKQQAARVLRISRDTLYRKIAEYGLRREDGGGSSPTGGGA